LAHELKTHERIGTSGSHTNMRSAGSRRLMMWSGSSPIACADTCPQPCKRQSPRQDRSRGSLLWDADRRRERSPEVERRVQEEVLGRPRLHQAQIGQPDENQSGRTRGGRNDTWARNARNGATPVRGSKPARGAEKPRSAAGRETQGRKEAIARRARKESPGQAANVRLA